MSGLHTRGYRPRRFSRVNLANGGTDTRRWWVLSWRYRREHSGDHLIMDAFDTLASACRDAREEPDPLVVRWRARGMRRGYLAAMRADQAHRDTRAS